MTSVLPLNEQFLTAEDAALKAKLSGLTVSASTDRAAGGEQEVRVCFRWPLRDYANVEWPFITLDLTDVRVDHEREHSYQWDEMGYLPDSVPANSTAPQRYTAPYPVPYTLEYVVGTHCRNAQHDRELFRQLLQPWLLPERFGFLEVAADDTLRRLDVLDVQAVNDLDSTRKRVFRRIFTIGINAEMLPEEARLFGQPVTQVVLDPTPASGLAPPTYVIS